MSHPIQKITFEVRAQSRAKVSIRDIGYLWYRYF